MDQYRFRDDGRIPNNPDLPLLVYRGVLDVEAADAAGDVVVIPAGVGHRNMGASADLLVVGAYPEGGVPDIRTGAGPAHDRTVDRIAQVPLPAEDPVFGAAGPLLERWRR